MKQVEWNNIGGLGVGLVALVLGILILRHRETVARVNGDMIMRFWAHAGTRTAKRSTPQEFVVVGIVCLVISAVAIPTSIAGLLN